VTGGEGARLLRLIDALPLDRREHVFTHTSWAPDRASSYERLEFLGDSVLGLVVTDLAYRIYPALPEGQLAKLRAAIVNMQALADVARALGIGELILLGKGEGQSGGHDKASLLADPPEGMAGSPLSTDGKPMGAVALSFPFSQDPVAGTRPIEGMLAAGPATRQAATADTLPKPQEYDLGPAKMAEIATPF